MAPTHEPTQARMVAAVRRRVRGVLVEVTPGPGLRCASVLPQDSQRMHARGVVVSGAFLGPSAVRSLSR
ncbi:MAG TPA: hypothetical protein VI542_08915 [Candidatus Tectomicrobia bacterium]